MPQVQTASLLLSCHLLLAAAPASAYLEIGPDDQQLSVTGPPLDPAYQAGNPVAAISRDSGRQLVCWQSNDPGNGENEIYCELLAPDGTTLVDDANVSEFGPTGPGSEAFDAYDPAVAHNRNADEFLVCWSGDTNEDGQVDNEREIFCRRLDAVGSPIGGYFRVSDQGGLGDTTEIAFRQAAAFDPQSDRYLVCWVGDFDDPPNSADNEYEVWCRFVASDGGLAEPPFVLSQMGPPGDPAFGADDVSVVYGGTEDTVDEFLVCWSGDDDSAGLVDGENELFCRRVVGATGALPGAQTRMSHQGEDGDASFDASRQALAFDEERLRYLLCWDGDTDAGGLADDELETYCSEWFQDLAPSTAATRVSFVGVDGDPSTDAVAPVAVSNGRLGWSVCWLDGSLPETEISCQMLRPGLARFGPPGAAVTSMGEGPGTGTANSPGIVRDELSGYWLVVWSGGSVDHGQVSGETEIFLQKIDPFGIFLDGFESGGTGAWVP